MKPLITIITPTYNRAHLLPRTWESLNNQTFTDFEWIVVDDGSTDQTQEYLNSLHDPRITYILQDNQGCNAARQRGEQEISAPFVVFFDSDDELYSKDTLRLMLNRISSAPSNIGLVAFAVITPEGGRNHSQFAQAEMVLGYKDIICGCKVKGECFRIIKREALSVAPWWTAGPGLLSLRYFKIAEKFDFLYVNETMLIYHMNHGSNLTSSDAAIKRAGAMVIGHMKLIDDHKAGWISACPAKYGTQLFHTAMYAAIDGQLSLAFKLSTQSLFQHGPRLNNLLLLLSLALPLPWRRRIFTLRSRLRGRV